MEEFYNSFTFIVAFSVLALIIDMTMGRKITTGFLALVFASMLVVNAGALEQIAKNLSGG